jgi:hypothetical protein
MPQQRLEAAADHPDGEHVQPDVPDAIVHEHSGEQAPRLEGAGQLWLLLDNKTMTLGDKRNRMVNMARGTFITFADDDDLLSEDYVDTLVDAIDYIDNPDVINFMVNISINGGEYKPVHYSIKYKQDYNDEVAYYRIPNHLMCVRTELAKATPYKPIIRGEDSAYAKDLFPKLRREHNLNKVLYYYNFNQKTTVTQKPIK